MDLSPLLRTWQKRQTAAKLLIRARTASRVSIIGWSEAFLVCRSKKLARPAPRLTYVKDRGSISAIKNDSG